MTKKYLMRFIVTGSGHFPIDMLRYDRAWPWDMEAVENMRSDRMERRQIELGALFIGDKRMASATVDRWASFGWSVSCQSICG
jgi:hypothetical protein